MTVDFYRDVFQWHERFLPCVVGGRLLLLEERETLLFSAPEVLQLDAVLSRRISLEMLEQQGWSGELASLLYLLEELSERRLIQPSGTTSHIVPDATASPRRIDVTARIEALSLSVGLGDEEVSALARGLEHAHDAPLTVVCCDDLADPRLAAVERRQHALGRAWLLCKPTGMQAAVGPLFEPDRSGNACWHCLAQRVLWNRPITAWWLARHGELPRVPIAVESALVAKRLARLPSVARALLRGARSQLISTWNCEDEPVIHAVTRRPQCAACGDPHQLQRQQRQPISIARCAKLPGGGSRSVPAELSLQRLQPHISTLCGPIAQLEPVAAESGVYRSAFFKRAQLDATLPPSELMQVCLGKGISTAQARVSALGEALERYAAQYQGDEACVESAVEALDGPCILPQGSAATRWAPAWSLTHAARRYLPFEYCYANTPWQQVHAAASWTSNGCAAGNTLEEAILQGLLELVERDAAAIWWYNRIQRPAFAWHSLPPRCREYVSAMLPREWNAWVLDLTHDLGIPVAAAVAHHRTQAQWALGFGCSLSGAHACERALTELIQLVAVQRNVTVTEEQAFLLPSTVEATLPSHERDTDDVSVEIQECVRSLARQGLECVVLDYSRPDLPLRTVKVVVPGLCHIWPGRFSERLQQVPVALHWRANATAPADLNPQPLYL